MARRVVHKRTDGKWAWSLEVNGRIVATDGGQGYETQHAAREMADRIISGEFGVAEKLVEA